MGSVPSQRYQDNQLDQQQPIRPFSIFRPQEPQLAAKRVGEEVMVEIEDVPQLQIQNQWEVYGGSQEVQGLIKEGDNFYRLQKFEEAISCYQRANQQDLQNIVILTRLGKALYQGNKIAQSVRQFCLIYEINPAVPMGLVGRGIQAIEDEEIDRAIGYLQKAIQLDCKNYIAYNNLGIAFCMLKKFEEGMKLYQKAIDIEPKYSNAYNNMGNAYRQQTDYTMAIKKYKTAISIDPKSAFPENGLGATLFEMKQPRLALVHCLRALELNPEYESAAKNLQLILTSLQRQTDEEGMTQLLQKVREENPNSKLINDKIRQMSGNLSQRNLYD